LKKLMLAGLMAVLGLAPAVALAQAQAKEMMLVGQVQSVDETGTKITLTDGTKLTDTARIGNPARSARRGHDGGRDVP